MAKPHGKPGRLCLCVYYFKLNLFYRSFDEQDYTSHKRRTGDTTEAQPGLAFTVDFDYRGNIAHLRERALKWLLI